VLIALARLLAASSTKRARSPVGGNVVAGSAVRAPISPKAVSE